MLLRREYEIIGGCIFKFFDNVLCVSGWLRGIKKRCGIVVVLCYWGWLLWYGWCRKNDYWIGKNFVWWCDCFVVW